MKKIWTIVGVLAVVAIVGSLFTVAALAQGPMGRDGAYGDHQGYGTRGEFVDEDGDGVCDTCLGTGEFSDEDGDGVCDTCVDEDGDGVCDNGHGNGAGLWIDEDGDGVNDNAPADGTGSQYGRSGGSMGGRRGGRR